MWDISIKYIYSIYINKVFHNVYSLDYIFFYSRTVPRNIIKVFTSTDTQFF